MHSKGEAGDPNHGLDAPPRPAAGDHGPGAGAHDQPDVGRPLTARDRTWGQSKRLRLSFWGHEHELRPEPLRPEGIGTGLRRAGIASQ